MYKSIKKLKAKIYLLTFYSFFYTLLVGLPKMLIGSLKDKFLLSKETNDIVSRDIKTHGIHVFKEIIKKDAVRHLLNDFEKLRKTERPVLQGQLRGRIYKEGILTPLLGSYANKIEPHVINFLHTKKVKIEISYYQESLPSEDVNEVPGGEFHVDDNKANLKYFIYLTDVGVTNGPFSCVPATGNWRLRGSLLRGIFWELTKKRVFLYRWLINYDFFINYEKKITGKSGTHFLVDTTSLHRAWPVLKGKRIVAVISFNRD
jgi:hypothetical protein